MTSNDGNASGHRLSRIGSLLGRRRSSLKTRKASSSAASSPSPISPQIAAKAVAPVSALALALAPVPVLTPPPSPRLPTARPDAADTADAQLPPAPPSYTDVINGRAPGADVSSSSSSAPASGHLAPPIIRLSSPAPSNASSAFSASSRLTADSIRAVEDPYAFLGVFDTVFVIDDSGSMAGRPWAEVRQALAKIVPICTRYDTDGVDIFFLNHRPSASSSSSSAGNGRRRPGKAAGGYLGVRSPDEVDRLFRTVRPGGPTPTGARLRSILTPYLRYYEVLRAQMREDGDFGDPDPELLKPVNVIVVTDGVPTDDLDDVLLKTASQLDRWDAPLYQVGVQFFQVGREPDAAAYLRHLDDDLGNDEPEPLRDIVDTVTWDTVARPGSGAVAPGLTHEGILKAVLGAVVKRIDRQ